MKRENNIYISSYVITFICVLSLIAMLYCDYCNIKHCGIKYSNIFLVSNIIGGVCYIILMISSLLYFIFSLKIKNFLIYKILNLIFFAASFLSFYFVYHDSLVATVALPIISIMQVIIFEVFNKKHKN